jgi:RNA polymerase sigma factor (sigma-70 family)
VTLRLQPLAVAPSHLDDAPVLVGDLYARHAAALHGFCLARLRNRHDAEEAVQATYLRALRALQTGIRPYSERAWLLTIARNVCASQATRAHRRREIALEPSAFTGDAAAPPTELGTDPDLLAALEALPDGQRRAFVLRAVEGLTYDEIATELGVSQAAVESWIFRARRKLAAAVGEHRRRLAADAASLLGGVKSLLAGGVALKASAAAVVAVATTTVVVGGPQATERAPAPGPPPVADSSRTSGTEAPDGVAPVRTSRRVAPVVGASARRHDKPAAGAPGPQSTVPPTKAEAHTPLPAPAPAPAARLETPAPSSSPVEDVVESTKPVTEPVNQVVETVVAPVLETPLPQTPALPALPALPEVELPRLEVPKLELPPLLP